MADGRRNKHSRHESLESRVRGNSQARFGGRPTEKDHLLVAPRWRPTRLQGEGGCHEGASLPAYWKPLVRHEALSDREGMKGPLRRAVAAVR
jgi:hypothetical protein